MATVPGYLLRHRIAVRPKTGSGPFGDTYGPEVTGIKAHVILGRPIVVKVGTEEITADVQVTVKPSMVGPEGSLVTYSGSLYRVLRRTDHTAPGMPTPDNSHLILVPHKEG